MFKLFKKKEENVGEVYVSYITEPFYHKMPAHRKANKILSELYPEDKRSYFWETFKESEVGESHDGFIEINHLFHKKENVFYYDDIYDSLRKKISKRIQKERHDKT